MVSKKSATHDESQSVGTPRAQGKEPVKFLKGVAISVWQNSCDTASNWSHFAKQKWPFFVFGVPTVNGTHNTEHHSNFWDKFAEDLRLAKALGSTSFRFSFEWSRIEPTRGVIDQSAVKRYTEMLDTMDKLGLVPNATLHHFVHPLWFEKLGGFAYEENLPLFVEWSKKVFAIWGHRIELWSTFNEPSCFSFLGYHSGMMPPGHILQPGNSGAYLLKLLKAHVLVYKALKAMPHGKEAQIGLVHHHISFCATGTGPIHWFSMWVARWLTKLWAWDAIEEWMQTGHFVWRIPFFGKWIDYQDPEGKPPCDWWGINYYTRAVVSWTLQATCLKGETMTDMFYPIHAQGLYDCIVRGSKFGIPMYITETGCPAHDDDRRRYWIATYWEQTMRAISEGYDVRGFYYWTLLDNFEWAMGFTMKFGLYAFEPDGSKDRVLKESSKPLVHIFKSTPDDMNELRLLAKKVCPITIHGDELIERVEQSVGHEPRNGPDVSSEQEQELAKDMPSGTEPLRKRVMATHG